MPMILTRIAFTITTALSSFFVGMQLDFSRHMEWLYLDPNILGSQVIQQSLSGTLDDYFIRNVFLHKTTVAVVDGMTIEQKAGQVLMPAWEQGTSLDEMVSIAKQYEVGGVMVLRNDATKGDVQVLGSALGFNHEDIVINPFLSIDGEPSLIKYRLPDSGYTTPTSDLTSVRSAYESADEIGRIISGYGYNVDFAPVYDSNHNTKIIGDRSFGSSTATVVPLANSFSDGLAKHGIISSAKHFPGHGHAEGDTHLSLQSVPGDLPELDMFREAIHHKIPMVMVGHLAIDGGEYDTQGLPSSLSPIAINLLRNDLFYDGVIITDGMNMGALNGIEMVDITSLESGVDIVLMPRDIEKTFEVLVKRMKEDKEFEKEINRKVYRIIRLKLVQSWLKEDI